MLEGVEFWHRKPSATFIVNMEMGYDYEGHGDDGVYSLSSDYSSDNEFWDEENEEEMLFYFVYVATTICKDRYSHMHLSWDQHVEKLQHKEMFSSFLEPTKWPTWLFSSC